MAGEKESEGSASRRGVVGYVDELILIPLGVMAVRSMVPPLVLEECRAKAVQLEEKPANWVAASVIVAIWIAIVVAGVYYLWR
jgi:hypothetical protein